MAGTVSRITAALTSVHNENANSLANLNIDFTLFKYEAPREYNALGETISRKRKKMAEEGALHKTARKLGALFKETLPPAEDLFRAYGTRVSEISVMPSINPREKDGIFASHVGIDTTSIWAAATSGSSAISAHLLGCMLARMFTEPEAISVWVEIVEKQKEKINARQGDQLYAQEHQAERIAALQEISRADLASWDASVRAWLQSADEAKALQQKQTMLILDNANIPVNNEPDTYTSVVKAWTAALEAMNNLTRGMPQTVQDGAALLAISSWHMYPDMAVYGRPVVTVKQNDPIFKPSALLTLGLQHIRDDKKSVYWSLPLAHLQHYGYPVRTSRSTGSESTRITYQQFAYILIGCLFAGWKKFARTNDEGLRWLQRLANVIQLPEEKESRDTSKPTWLKFIFNASRELDYCEASEKIAAFQLINLGRRRSTFLYGDNSPIMSPLFGLSDIQVLLFVLKNQQRVRLLRECCTRLNLSGTELVIAYPAFEGKEDDIDLDYASVSPIPQVCSKRRYDGSVKPSSPQCGRHRRWITLNHSQLEICYRRREEFLDISKTTQELEKLKEEEQEYTQVHSSENDEAFARLPCPQRQRRLDQITELSTVILIAQRRKNIEDLDEDCLPVAEWNLEPRHAFHDKGLIFSLETDFIDACGDISAKCNKVLQNPVGVCKKFYAGDIRTAALYSISVPEHYHESNMAGAGHHLTLGLQRFESFLSSGNFNMKNLYNYMNNPSSDLTREELRCLKAGAMMADIYKLLPGATISTLIVCQSLPEAKWIPRTGYQVAHPATPRHAVISPGSLNLPQTLACVAMFESGTSNIDPSSLSEAFAMSCGNSIYVAAALLCDPYDDPHDTELRRVVGNIGRTGITFLISPPEVKIREPDPEKWMSINHEAFDGALEDNFQDTSMHLSFTKYEVPLFSDNDRRHIIDHPAVLLESLISVFEGGTWVAEVDILKAIKQSLVRSDRWGSGHYHHQNSIRWDLEHLHSGVSSAPVTQFVTYPEALNEHSELVATSIDNWDELLEAPGQGLIAIRAHKNWLARLAATAMCIKTNFTPMLLPEDPCWVCCARTLRNSTSDNRIALIT